MRSQGEIGITEGTHFRIVQTTELDFLAHANRGDLVTDLEPDISHNETEDEDDGCIKALCPELRGVAVKQTPDAIKAVFGYHFITDNAVPTAAVFAIGEKTQRNDTPGSIHAVDADRTDRIIDASIVPEKY